jgi:hypothetical protein
MRYNQACGSADIEHDIADYFTAFAQLMGRSDVAAVVQSNKT